MGGRRKWIFFEGCQMPFTVATLKLGVRGLVERRSTNSWTGLFFGKKPVLLHVALCHVISARLASCHVTLECATVLCSRVASRRVVSITLVHAAHPHTTQLHN